MTFTKVTSTEWARHRVKIRRAATDNPVLITKRGKDAYVLMSYTEYLRIGGEPVTIAEESERRN